MNHPRTNLRHRRALTWLAAALSLFQLCGCATTTDRTSVEGFGPPERVLMDFDGGTARAPELRGDSEALPGRAALDIIKLTAVGDQGLKISVDPGLECQVAQILPQREVVYHERESNGWGLTLLTTGIVASVAGTLYSAVAIPSFGSLPPPSPLATENENRQNFNTQVVLPLSILGGGVALSSAALLGQIDTETIGPSPSVLRATNQYERCGGAHSIPGLSLAAVTSTAKQTIGSVPVTHDGETFTIKRGFGDLQSKLDAMAAIPRIFVRPRTCVTLPTGLETPLSWSKPTPDLVKEGLTVEEGATVCIDWAKNPIARGRLHQWRTAQLAEMGRTDLLSQESKGLLKALEKDGRPEVLAALEAAAALLHPGEAIPPDGDQLGSGALRLMMYKAAEASGDPKRFIAFAATFPAADGALFDKVDQGLFELVSKGKSVDLFLYMKKMKRGAYTEKVRELCASALVKEKSFETFLITFDKKHKLFKKARKGWLGKLPQKIARLIAKGALQEATDELYLVQRRLGEDDPLVSRLRKNLDAAWERREKKEALEDAKRAPKRSRSNNQRNNSQCVSAFWTCARVCKDAHCQAVEGCVQNCMSNTGYSMDGDCPIVLGYQIPCRQ